MEHLDILLNPASIGVGLGLFCLLSVVFIFWLRSGKAGKLVADSTFIKGQKKEKTKEKSILGTGEEPCYAFSKGEFFATTIPEPIGNLFMADQSMPYHGKVSLVRETSNGEVEAYDPRDEPFEEKKTPKWAYLALHWPEVQQIYGFIRPWWQSAPMWLAIAGVVLVFIFGLIYGG